MSTDHEQPFYKCTRCGACCKWPGDVCLEPEEVERIALFLKCDVDRFVDQYCRLRANRQGLSLIEDEEGACIMLDHGACRINPVKPAQCRDFPDKWNFPGWRELCSAVPVVSGR